MFVVITLEDDHESIKPYYKTTYGTLGLESYKARNTVANMNSKLLFASKVKK